MLQMMARENMEEWGASFPVVLDTIRVAVGAFAEGRIEFDSVPEKTRKTYIRLAPSFLPGGTCVLGDRTHAYTAQTLGKFLGWLVKDGNATMRLLHGLNALELVELDCMSAGNFEGLGKEEGYALTTATKKTYGRYIVKAKKEEKEATKAQKKGDTRLAKSQANLADKIYDRSRREFGGVRPVFGQGHECHAIKTRGEAGMRAKADRLRKGPKP